MSSIKRLPPEEARNIAASLHASSYSEVVRQLVLNAVQAHAKMVVIELQREEGDQREGGASRCGLSVTVRDNGVGMIWEKEEREQASSPHMADPLCPPPTTTPANATAATVIIQGGSACVGAKTMGSSLTAIAGISSMKVTTRAAGSNIIESRWYRLGKLCNSVNTAVDATHGLDLDPEVQTKDVHVDGAQGRYTLSYATRGNYHHHLYQSHTQNENIFGFKDNVVLSNNGNKGYVYEYGNENTPPLVFQSPNHAAHQDSGTTVYVWDLFMNIPVRRKYLAENIHAEMIQVKRIIAVIALFYPQVAFQLIDRSQKVTWVHWKSYDTTDCHDAHTRDNVTSPSLTGPQKQKRSRKPSTKGLHAFEIPNSNDGHWQKSMRYRETSIKSTQSFPCLINRHWQQSLRSKETSAKLEDALQAEGHQDSITRGKPVYLSAHTRLPRPVTVTVHDQACQSWRRRLQDVLGIGIVNQLRPCIFARKGMEIHGFFAMNSTCSVQTKSSRSVPASQTSSEFGYDATARSDCNHAIRSSLNSHSKILSSTQFVQINSSIIQPNSVVHKSLARVMKFISLENIRHCKSKLEDQDSYDMGENDKSNLQNIHTSSSSQAPIHCSFIVRITLPSDSIQLINGIGGFVPIIKDADDLQRFFFRAISSTSFKTSSSRDSNWGKCSPSPSESSSLSQTAVLAAPTSASLSGPQFATSSATNRATIEAANPRGLRIRASPGSSKFRKPNSLIFSQKRNFDVPFIQKYKNQSFLFAKMKQSPSIYSQTGPSAGRIASLRVANLNNPTRLAISPGTYPSHVIFDDCLFDVDKNLDRFKCTKSKRLSLPKVVPKIHHHDVRLLNKFSQGECDEDVSLMPMNMRSCDGKVVPKIHRHDIRFLNKFSQGERKEDVSLMPVNMSRDVLKHMKVIGQWEKKFLLVLTSNSSTLTIHVIDQHAADERVKLEQLQKSLVRDHAVQSVPLENPEILILTHDERLCVEKHLNLLHRWGWVVTKEYYHRSATSDLNHLAPTINVQYLLHSYPCFLGKYHRGVEHLMRFLSDVENKNFNASSSSSLSVSSWEWPSCFSAQLKSLSCRSAIMFGTPLSKDQCTDLINNLSECSLPFQCAHGRPSIIPLLTVDQNLFEREPCRKRRIYARIGLDKLLKLRREHY